MDKERPRTTTRITNPEVAFLLIDPIGRVIHVEHEHVGIIQPNTSMQISKTIVISPGNLRCRIEIIDID